MEGVAAGVAAPQAGLLREIFKVPPPRKVVVAPIAINGRVVCLVHGHAQDSGEIADAIVADLASVCAAAAAALTRLIHTAK